MTVEIAPCSNVGPNGGKTEVAIRINVPEGFGDRPACDIACVVDISGSMWNFATYETCDGKETNDGFTILNIVQHAINAVMNML